MTERTVKRKQTTPKEMPPFPYLMRLHDISTLFTTLSLLQWSREVAALMLKKYFEPSFFKK